jgi:hypothetical protein
MQRIDDDTYIDDTLVTCAEYQLFIDEMREQGKYYQPDHWASSQFQEGQALEPILGIRQADAVAFCQWITQRENAGWKYRLPTYKETIANPIKISRISPLGYWIIGDYQFAWVGSVPKNPRRIKIDLTFYRDEASDGTNTYALDMDSTVEYHNNMVRERLLTRNPARNLELNAALFTIRDYIDNLDFGIILDQDLERNVDINPGREARDRALATYIDLFTLQERIAERSPAFEGIRLVKERIR